MAQPPELSNEVPPTTSGTAPSKPKATLLGQVREFAGFKSARDYNKLVEEEGAIGKQKDDQLSKNKFYIKPETVYPPFFSAIGPLLWEAEKGNLTEEMLVDCVGFPPELLPRTNAEQFIPNWEQEQVRARQAALLLAQRAKAQNVTPNKRCGSLLKAAVSKCLPRGLRTLGKDEPSLLRAMFTTYRRWIILLALPRALISTLRVCAPICLGEMLRAIEQGRPQDSTPWALLLFATRIGIVCIEGVQDYMNILVGSRIRGALVSTLFVKSQRLDPGARAELGLGNLVNVMQGDVVNIGNACGELHRLWEVPLLLLLALIVLFWKMGFLGVAAMVLMALFVPFNAWVVKSSRQASFGSNAAKDKRVKMLSGALHGMKVVKMLAWEEPIQRVLQRNRDEEMSFIRTLKKVTVINNCIDWMTPVLLPLLLFAGAFAFGRKVTASVAFSALSILDVIQGPMNELPRMLVNFTNLLVGVDRAKRVLVALELQVDTCEDGWNPSSPFHGSSTSRTSVDLEAAENEPLDAASILRGPFASSKGRYSRGAPMSEMPAVHFLSGTELQWFDSDTNSNSDKQKGDETPRTVAPAWSLQIGAELKVPPGTMVHVCGNVGAGKSTMLQALLGEVRLSGGGVALRGRQVTYCAQEPWVRATTLRDNITFGHKFYPERFDRVVEACGLASDIGRLAKGDQTLVGERGVTLSGGQRARLALARACYPDPDVIILDDVLSAVDARVARHIVRNCLCGPHALLNSVTRILALPAGGFQGLLPHPDLTWELAGGEVYEIRRKASCQKDEENEFPEKEGSMPNEMMEKVDAADAAKVVQAYSKEEREQGRVRLNTWMSYLRVLGWHFLVAAIPLYAASQGTMMASTFTLAAWTDASSAGGDVSQTGFLITYAALLLGAASVVLIRNCLFAFFGSLRASRKIHDTAMPAVLYAPMSFFYSTPAGRIINRFATDLSTVDMSVMPPMQGLFKWTYDVILGVGAVLFVTPPLVVLLFPAFWLYHRINQRQRSAAREFVRLLALTRSVFIVHYEEMLHGVAHVRAWGAEDSFRTRGEDLRIPALKLGWLLTAAEMWKRTRLSIIANTLMLAVALFARWTCGGPNGQGSSIPFVPVLSAGLLGVMLRYTLQITGDFGVWIHLFTETEMNLVSVERMVAYSAVEREREVETGEAWVPVSAPAIRFSEVELSYGRPGVAEVKALQGVTFYLPPGQSLGVCGRTGAGKSSLVVALFQLVNLQGGQITVDGLDISRLRLRDLRRGLGSIPQEPLLFAGDLRFNLDPMGERTFVDGAEDFLWEVLDVLGLAAMVRERGGLAMSVEVGGANLSTGERQLLATARALVQRPVVLILDEATANVDEVTEQRLMSAVRTAAGSVTTLSIAHRVRTLLTLDKVMVLADGRVEEIGEPSQLLQDPEGAFHKLVEASSAEVGVPV